MSGDLWCSCGACLTVEEIDMGQCGCCGRRFRQGYRPRKPKPAPLLDRPPPEPTHIAYDGKGLK